jgi:hypothetical protein
MKDERRPASNSGCTKNQLIYTVPYDDDDDDDEEEELNRVHSGSTQQSNFKCILACGYSMAASNSNWPSTSVSNNSNEAQIETQR